MLKQQKTRTGSIQAQGVVFPWEEKNKLTALKRFKGIADLSSEVTD